MSSESDKDQQAVRGHRVTPMGWVATILAIGSLLSYVGIIAAIMAIDLSPETIAIVKDMSTDLRAILLMVFGFFFGSSIGSWRKNDQPR